MNRLHHAKLPFSIALTALLLAGCGGGSADNSSLVFTKCTAAGVHSSDAPSEYRLFPLLAEDMNVVSNHGSVRFSVTGRDNKGNAISGTHSEYIDRSFHDETNTPATEYRELISYTEWTGSGEHPKGTIQYFWFDTSDPNTHFPLPDGAIDVYELMPGTRDVFGNVIVIGIPNLLNSFQFELIEPVAIPPTASPGDSGSLGTYMSGSEYTLERTWSLQNAKDDLGFLNIQSVVYRTTDRSAVFEENISYQINEEGERQCVALYASDRESDFSIRLEGTFEETPANN